jgi:uncharacterized protein
MDRRVDVAFPLQVGSLGRTGAADPERHLRDLIEQLLFTAPGERVNRPGFGTPLVQLLFLPNAEPLAAATRAAVEGALTQWLGELIQVRGVDAVADESVLRVTVRYAARRTGSEQVATFTRTAP